MFWRKMPAHQLALAAERQALRKSFGQQRDDLRLLDTRYLQTKAGQLLRAAAPAEHALIQSEAQRQELLFGHDEPDPIEGEVEQQPASEPPAKVKTWPPSEQNRFGAELRRRTLSLKKAVELLGLTGGEWTKCEAWSALGSVDEVLAGIDAAIERQAEDEQQATLAEAETRPF